jgi:hypothetical protein
VICSEKNQELVFAKEGSEFAQDSHLWSVAGKEAIPAGFSTGFGRVWESFEAIFNKVGH